jgi:hypothetical protein
MIMNGQAVKLLFIGGLIGGLFGSPMVASALTSTLTAEVLAGLKQQIESVSTADEIDTLIDQDDRLQVGPSQGIIFENFHFSPRISACSMRIEVSDLESVLNDAALRDRYMRIAGFECRKNIDFSLNSLLKDQADVDLARNAYTCSIVSTTKGYAAERSEHLVGMAGSITRERLFLPDKTTEFDNRKVVVTTTPGRNPRIEVSCVIHTRPLERQELTQAFRRQWREAKLVELQKSIDFAIAEEQRKQVELVEKRKVASGQLAELVGAMKRSEGLVAQYEQCLSSHRIADRIYLQMKSGLPSGNSKLPPGSCGEKMKKISEWTAVASDRIQASEISAVEASVSHQESLLALGVEKTCRERLEVCTRSSFIGKLTDSVRSRLVSPPNHHQQR